jgi:hypothetical protein
MKTGATFRLFGGTGLTSAAVTERLGITPTRAFEAGSQPRPRSAARTSSGWLLRTEVEAGVELTVQLERLLSQLEPHAATLWALTEAGYDANWFCYVASHATEHAVELDRDLLARLLALPGELWLDVSGDAVDDDAD